MAIDNGTDISREKNIKHLAVLDWAHTPAALLKEEFKVTAQTLSHWRLTDTYKEMASELKSEWMEEMLRLPSTMDLRKKVSQGMTLAVNVLIDILATNHAAKDKISAARLVAQLDGRFLREEGGEGKDVDSLAQELISVMQKQSQKVN